jgi:hypothetical protein
MSVDAEVEGESWRYRNRMRSERLLGTPLRNLAMIITSAITTRIMINHSMRRPFLAEPVRVSPSSSSDRWIV